jgi:hypothetical protein
MNVTYFCTACGTENTEHIEFFSEPGFDLFEPNKTINLRTLKIANCMKCNKRFLIDIQTAANYTEETKA